MHVIGIKTVRINRLNLPGDFKQRVEHPRITERAESAKKFGILAEPMVRKRDYRVIYGRDRIATAVRIGKTEMDVKLVECSDDEAYELELLENVQRRHDSDEQRLGFERMVKLYEDQVRGDVEAGALPPDPRRGPGRRKTPRGMARDRVARELGIKPASVKRKEARIKVSLRNEKLDGERKPAPQIELIGMDVTDEFLREVEKIQQLIDGAAGHLNTALTALTQCEKLPYPPARLQRIYDEVRVAASLVRANKPASMCPWCKGLPTLQEQCGSCLGSGWISVEAAKTVPQELWVAGDKALVTYRGQYARVREVMADLADGTPPALSTLVKAEQDLEEDLFA